MIGRRRLRSRRWIWIQFQSHHYGGGGGGGKLKKKKENKKWIDANDNGSPIKSSNIFFVYFIHSLNEVILMTVLCPYNDGHHHHQIDQLPFFSPRQYCNHFFSYKKKNMANGKLNHSFYSNGYLLFSQTFVVCTKWWLNRINQFAYFTDTHKHSFTIFF